MTPLRILWDWDDDPEGNVQHIAEHGLNKEDVESVLAHPESSGVSHSSGLPAAFGETPDGRYIIVVYQEIDEDSVRPVTAYED
jgi:uncharacterized DUF497 family protein